MKILLPSYNFNSQQKSVTLNGIATPQGLEAILLVTNVSKNQIIYNFADPNLGGHLVSNTLYLSADTTGMLDSDRLQIFVDEQRIPASDAQLISTNIAVAQAVEKLTDVVTRADTTNYFLNELNNKQTTVNLDVSALNVNTDQVETLLSDTNELLADISNSNLIGSTSEFPLFVNQGNLDSSIDSVSVPNIDNIKNNTDRLLNIENYTSYLQTYLPALTPIQGYVNTITNNTSRLSSIENYTDTIKNTIINEIVQGVLDTSITQTTTSQLTSRLYISGFKRVYSIFGVSQSTNNQYIHVYDTNNLILTGAPVGVFMVPANSNFSFDINKGLKFTSGCLVVNSLTLTTYSGGANDLYFTVVHTN